MLSQDIAAMRSIYRREAENRRMLRGSWFLLEAKVRYRKQRLAQGFRCVAIEADGSEGRGLDMEIWWMRQTTEESLILSWREVDEIENGKGQSRLMHTATVFPRHW